MFKLWLFLHLSSSWASIFHRGAMCPMSSHSAVWRRGCCHLVGWGQGWCYTPHHAQDSIPGPRVFLPVVEKVSPTLYLAQEMPRRRSSCPQGAHDQDIVLKSYLSCLTDTESERLFLPVPNIGCVKDISLSQLFPIFYCCLWRWYCRKHANKEGKTRSFFIGSTMTVHWWWFYPNISNVLETVQTVRQLVKFLMSEAPCVWEAEA